MYIHYVVGMIAHKPHKFHYFLWEYYFLLIPFCFTPTQEHN